MQELVAACPDETGAGTHLCLAGIHSLDSFLALSTTPGTMLASLWHQPGKGQHCHCYLKRFSVL